VGYSGKIANTKVVEKEDTRPLDVLNILYIERKNKREKRERKRKHTMDYIVLCCDDIDYV
jgi:hypothetical protein